MSEFVIPESRTESNFGNIFTVPGSIISNALSWTKAKEQGDIEGQVNSFTQLLGAPLSVLSQLFGLIFRVYEVSSFLNVTEYAPMVAPFFKPMAYTTLALSGIETVYYGLGLARQITFLSEIRRREGSPHEFFDLIYQEYLGVRKSEEQTITREITSKCLSLNPEEIRELRMKREEEIRQKKMAALSRRISPWLTKELADLFSKGQRSLPKERVEQLMQDIDTQAKKILIVHALGIATIFLMVTGVILALAGVASILPVVFTSLSMLTSTAQYLLEYGFVDSRGWNFSFVNCIPNWIVWIFNGVFGTDLKYTLPSDVEVGSASGA